MNNKVKFGVYIANHGITSNPQDYQEILSYIRKYRKSLDAFDLVKSILTVGNKEEDAYIHDFMPIGVNWLLEAFWSGRCSLKDIQKRIERGPPE